MSGLVGNSQRHVLSCCGSFVYLKIFILLYADDTIILADSAENLHCALNIYAAYCEKWKSVINF